MLRNPVMLWTLSVGFELMELTFQHLLPNFNECWWDRRGARAARLREGSAAPALLEATPAASTCMCIRDQLALVLLQRCPRSLQSCPRAPHLSHGALQLRSEMPLGNDCVRSRVVRAARSWLLDVLICNWLGIWAGMRTVKWFGCARARGRPLLTMHASMLAHRGPPHCCEVNCGRPRRAALPAYVLGSAGGTQACAWSGTRSRARCQAGRPASHSVAQLERNAAARPRRAAA